MRPWLIPALLALSLLTLGVGLAAGLLWSHAWDPAWVAAAGQIAGAAATASAVSWAAATFVIEQKDLREQRDRERQESRARELRDASKVWAWVTFQHGPYGPPDGPLNNVVVGVRNGLDSDIRIESAVPGELHFTDAPTTKARVAARRDEAFSFRLQNPIAEGGWDVQTVDVGGTSEVCLIGVQADIVYRIGDRVFSRSGFDTPKIV